MYELIIIGAGPAGLTAGLYAGRFRLKTLILEKMGVGGQIVTSPTIENFPGFPGGIATVDLIDRLKRQVDEVEVGIENAEVLEILPNLEMGMPRYLVKTEQKSYETKCIIIATGAQSKKLGVKGEDSLSGKGISYCATCDGPLFRKKEVVVVGGGDRAIEEAIFLTSYSSKVTVVHRRAELRASEILVEKAKANPKISFLFNSVVDEISGTNVVESVKVRDLKTGLVYDYPTQGVFVFIGILPNTIFLKNLLNKNELGFIITAHGMHTTHPGIFACGDCIDKSLYQVVNACGDGAVAADSAHKYLLKMKA